MKTYKYVRLGDNPHPIPYAHNPTSKFKVGQRIRFKRLDEVIVEDTVRWCFWQHVALQPWGEDLLFPALVLTEHSWTAESNVIAVQS